MKQILLITNSKNALLKAYLEHIDSLGHQRTICSESDIIEQNTKLPGLDLVVYFAENQNTTKHVIKLIRLFHTAPIVLQSQLSLSQKSLGASVIYSKREDNHYIYGLLDAILQPTQNISVLPSLAQCASVVKFNAHTLDDTLVICQFIDALVPEKKHITKGVYELLTNAVEHGIYNIGFEKKRELLSSKSYFAELNRRSNELSSRDSHCEFICSINENTVQFKITDPGMGFNFEQYLEADPDHADSPCGRGIAYAFHTSFDKMEYSNNGRSVNMLVNID